MKKVKLKHQLLATFVSVLLCCAMLMGTTFALFSESISTGVNIIESGDLDVVLKWSKDFGAWDEVTKETAVFNDTSLWEPGHLEIAYLEISNAGTLALQYNLSTLINKEVEGTNQYGRTYRFSDYLVFAYVDDVTAPYHDRNSAVAAAEALGKTFGEGDLNGSLLPGESKRVAIMIYMSTSVGNEANPRSIPELPTIHFGILLNATQLSYEDDSYGIDYDESAGFRMVLDYAPLKDGSGLVVVGIGTHTDSIVRIPSYVDGSPVVGIAGNAFRDLMRITKIELPDTLYHIEGGAFLGAGRLQSITPSAGNTYFKTENNALYSADGSRLVWYPDAYGRIEVPATVTTIASYAFADRTNIKEVIVPDTLTAVGVGAFDGCTNLQFNRYENGYYIGNDTNPYVALIKLDPSVTEIKTHSDTKVIADDALSGCPNLTEVQIPAGTTVINQWMLLGSPNVTVITVPMSVTVIGELAFAGLDKLETVIIPESVTEIGDSAFEGCTSLESVTIPQGAVLGDNVFKDCESLTEVKFSSTTDEVPAGAFEGCTSLESIAGLGTLSNVGENAFAGCVELQGDIYISQDAVIGSGAFEGCTDEELNLVITTDTVGIPETWADDWSGTTTVRVHYAKDYSHDATAHWFTCVESGCGYQSKHTAHTFDYTTDYLCTVCDRQAYVKNQSYGLAIENGLVVGKGTCIETTVYVNMPIAANAFYNDNTIETVVLSSGVTSIGENAFGADSDLGVLKHVVFTFANCTELVVADGLFAENRNSAMTVFVPSAVVDAYKALGAAGGDWQTNVAPLIVGCEVSVLDSLASMYASTSSSTFRYGDGGTTITGFATNAIRALYRDNYPDNLVLPTFVNGKLITKVYNDDYDQHDYSFGALKINTLVVAGAITHMTMIFDHSSFNTVIIGDSVEYIGFQTFEGCSIKKLILGSGIKEIGKQSFNRASVGEVYYRGTPEDWSNISFYADAWSDPSPLKNAKRYYYSEVDPNTYIENYSGNYWHYDQYGEIAIWSVT